MGYKSRTKKRAQRSAQRQQRDSKEGKTRHYLTLNRYKACCNECAGILKEGAEIVFRYRPREILCLRCADAKGVKPRPSLRWEEANQRKARRGPAWMRDPA
jgi:hypothetical protein